MESSDEESPVVESTTSSSELARLVKSGFRFSLNEIGTRRLEREIGDYNFGKGDFSGDFSPISLKNLYYLDASDNRISGRIPSTLPESLVQISMRNNFIRGTIPQSFKLLSSLQVIDLAHNKLSGSIPSFIFTHQSLQQLTLSFNGFTSLDSPYYSPLSLPSELTSIDLNNNRIQGVLPLFLGLSPKLSALSLENNNFFGMIPTQYVLKTVSSGSEFARFQRLLRGHPIIPDRHYSTGSFDGSEAWLSELAAHRKLLLVVSGDFVLLPRGRAEVS
ncbi:PREDICTED: MDIS1-interacting receptor like kinase 1-like [Camelina sativa]|uniref:MDIS1-interacting receptor like kinase 1-like n=1 Tax=Camelina sativa TaxID=90675 RepID=A0ABM1RKQ1_CAMSA|nr:PREDICTED: MDIS1-interacting receptor like kinase 1-like [Camelina sativa]